MSITNSAAFNRAHDDYYRVPDDDDYDTCQDCSDGKIPNPDFDPGETSAGMMEDEFCECEECHGTGQINVSAVRRGKARAAKEYADECRFEQQRDEK